MKINVWCGVAAITAMLCGAAQAHKYNCEFQKDGNALHKCSIESLNGGQACQYDFSANLRGVCGASGDPNVDLLFCAITTPSGAAASFLANLPRGSAATAARALSQKPGFLAGGLAIAPAGKGIIAGLYLEQQGSATLAGVCTP